MNRIRTAALAVLTVCAVSLGLTGTASAAQGVPKTPMTKKVALTGTKGFKGTYTIDRFTTRNGKMVLRIPRQEPVPPATLEQIAWIDDKPVLK